MVNYANSKIYKIVDNSNGNIYIGSTCKLLCQRLAAHRADYKLFLKTGKKNITSFTILENNDYDIVLIELFQCDSKEELHKRERYFIELLDCVNKIIPGRSFKEYNNDNRDKIKNYTIEHKENKKLYNKTYYKIKIICSCGAEIIKSSQNRHFKCKNHLKYVLEQAANMEI